MFVYVRWNADLHIKRVDNVLITIFWLCHSQTVKAWGETVNKTWSSILDYTRDCVLTSVSIRLSLWSGHACEFERVRRHMTMLEWACTWVFSTAHVCEFDGMRMRVSRPAGFLFHQSAWRRRHLPWILDNQKSVKFLEAGTATKQDHAAYFPCNNLTNNTFYFLPSKIVFTMSCLTWWGKLYFLIDFLRLWDKM
jgi:hypothetical protein